MSDHVDGIRLMILVVAILLRFNGFVYMYLKRKDVWIGPAIVLNLFSPVLALLTISIITSKNHKELSRSSTAWPAFLLIGAFLLSQFFAGAIFVGAVFTLGYAVPTGRILGPGATTGGFTPIYLLGLISLYSVILISILRLLRPRLGWQELMKGKKVLITSKVLYLLLIPLTLLIWGFGALVEEAGLTPSTNPLLEFNGSLNSAAIFWAIVIVAPFIEELFFRGYLFKVFEERLGSGAAIILTAFLFAAAHFNLLTLLPLLLMGFIMGWARSRTGSIIPSLVMHSMNNLIAFLLIILN